MITISPYPHNLSGFGLSFHVVLLKIGAMPQGDLHSIARILPHSVRWNLSNSRKALSAELSK